MNAIIRLLEPPYSDLTYALPRYFPDSFWKVGMRVAIPLRFSPVRAGIIYALNAPDVQNIKLKDVIWPLDERPLLSPAILSLLEETAHRAGLAGANALGLLIPFSKKITTRLRRLSATKLSDAIPISEIQKASLSEKKRWAQELCAGEAHMLPPCEDAAKEERCLLAMDPPWPIRPSAVKQKQILEELSFRGALSKRALIQSFGPTTNKTIATLVSLGCLQIERSSEEEHIEALQNALLAPLIQQNFSLNEDQQNAVTELEAALEKGESATRLLFGVTGSGKTAVYMAAIGKALALKKSALLLAPEVAIAHKLHRDSQQAFPDAKIYFYHGYQNSRKREECFRALAGSNLPSIVVGTRSALFLPLPQLGLIILDEEHDASFKQEESLPYHAKEVAWFRARNEKAVLVLGSATPDMKTWQAAQHKAFPILSLPKRVADRPLPPVELVDISKGKMLLENRSQLDPLCITALNETIERGEQAIILLNRRGFAPLIFCTDCKKTLTCPHCSVGLSFHKNESRIVCHYCGWSIPFPSPCPVCHNMNFLPVGEGTERLAEYLDSFYAGRVLRLDRDTTRRNGAMEEILAAFATHKANILVGTQMLSKGHHFPDVTLSIIADADIGLNLPDYRAAERTFQLMLQSAGRAGRGEKPGRVLIQTRDTSHYCWQYIKAGDYEGFCEEELRRRKRYNYPPFSRLSLIRISYDREDKKADEAMNLCHQAIPAEAQKLGILAMGPILAPLPFIGGKRRYQCLVKGKDWLGARNLYLRLLAYPWANKLHIQLDPDPVNML